MTANAVALAADHAGFELKNLLKTAIEMREHHRLDRQPAARASGDRHVAMQGENA